MAADGSLAHQTTGEGEGEGEVRGKGEGEAEAGFAAQRNKT